MSAHDDCAAPGKFDCTADEFIQDLALDTGDGEGDVASPVAWFLGIVLNPDDPREREAIEHYGTRYLVAREFDSGAFSVERYETAAYQRERLDALRGAYADWDVAVLSW